MVIIPVSRFSFKPEKYLTRPQTRPNIFIYLLDHQDEPPLANIKRERQRWSEKLLISVCCHGNKTDRFIL